MACRKAVVVYTSNANPGAKAIAEELKASLHEGATIRITTHAPASPIDVEEAEPPTHWLLLLSRATFLSNTVLEEELKVALKADFLPVLVHENDAQQGGCEFKEILEMAPDELKELRLFDPMAVPWHPGVHRAVNLRQLAVKLGAKPCRMHNTLHHLISRAKFSLFRPQMVQLQRGQLDDEALLRSKAIQMNGVHDAPSINEAAKSSIKV